MGSGTRIGRRARRFRAVWHLVRRGRPGHREVLPDEPALLVGKTIAAVVYAERQAGGPPRCQLVLLFEDGTQLELYTSDEPIRFCHGLDRGGLRAALRTIAPPAQVRCYTRDLEWEMVKE